MRLAGRVAYRRLVERGTASSPYSEAARHVLAESYTQLLGLFVHAMITIAVPTMANTLRDLRDTLVAAMAHPISGVAVPTVESQRRKDP
jgi:hypothetical protein